MKLLLSLLLTTSIFAKEPIVSQNTIIATGAGALAGYLVNQYVPVNDKTTKVFLTTTTAAVVAVTTKQYLAKGSKWKLY